MLSDRNEHRLMVRRRVDTRKPVHTRGEPIRHVGRNDTILLRTVDALEERELVRVCRGRLVEGLELLDDDVRVADDLSLCVHLLGCGVVVGLRVDEVACLDVVERHLDRERLVGLDGPAVRREHELRGRHVRRRGDDTHRSRVAGTRLDLRAVRDGFVGRETEVDEVVSRREGGDLPVSGDLLTVECEAGRDDGWVKRRTVLVVTSVPAVVSIVSCIPSSLGSKRKKENEMHQLQKTSQSSSESAYRRSRSRSGGGSSGRVRVRTAVVTTVLRVIASILSVLAVVSTLPALRSLLALGLPLPSLGALSLTTLCAFVPTTESAKPTLTLK
jgi:hypothetical protein